MGQGKAGDGSWHREQNEQDTAMKLPGTEGNGEQHGSTPRECRVRKDGGGAEGSVAETVRHGFTLGSTLFSRTLEGF